MSDQPVLEHLGLRRRLDAAKQKLNELTEILRGVVHHLTDATKTGTEPILPDGKKWPTAEALAAAREECHRLSVAVADTWKALGKEGQYCLLPPPQS